MSFPKNKRRTIIVDGIEYQWCVSHYTFYYKRNGKDEKLYGVALPETRSLSITPKDATVMIAENNNKLKN